MLLSCIHVYANWLFKIVSIDHHVNGDRQGGTHNLPQQDYGYGRQSVVRTTH